MTADDPLAQPSAMRMLADEYWEAFLDAEPLYASMLGDHRFDSRAGDVSAKAEQDQRRRWVKLRDRAVAMDESKLNETDRVTRELLVGELDTSIRWIDLRLTELTSDQMQGPHANLLMLAERLQATDPEQAFMAMLRLNSMADLLDQAARRFKEAVAAGRTPARINIARTCNQVDSYLASPLADDPFAKLPGPAEWPDEPQWREDMFEAVREKLRPGFARYRDAITRELAPVARGDDQPGLAYLPDGGEVYEALIHHHTGLPLTADELHELGLEQMGQIHAEFAEVGRRVFGTADRQAVFDRLLSDQNLRYRSADELLDHASTCLKKSTAVMGDWFGILPMASCVLSPVPDYLAADVPPAYYSPPSPDGDEVGKYHVNLHEATARGRFHTASVAYHEAIPGHHLQLAISAERVDLPAFRRYRLSHTAFIEGWGLYAERLADEMGLYEDDLDRLGMLTSDAWRAGRLVVDTGLHSRGWSRQQAIDYLAANVPLDRDTITVEVDRYIGMPGQALAYKVGQREIFELRAQAKAQLGGRYDVKSFHDVVLGAATVSLPVLRRRVADWLAEPT